MKRKVAIHNAEGFRVFDANEIVRIKADGSGTSVFLTSGRQISSSQTLGYYCEQLKEATFFRTHEKHLVNVSYVANYINGKVGILEMRDGYIVPVAGAEKKVFRRYLNA